MVRRCVVLATLFWVWLLCAVVAVAARGETDLPAPDRGLTATDVKPILLAVEGQLYHKDVSKKNFHGKVLGYVTPWNSHGYEVATRWRAKFTHISPVWYQLRADESGSGFHLTGGHDVDQGWIARLREPAVEEGQCSGDDTASQTCSTGEGVSKAPPLVVPRFIFELAPQELLTALESHAAVTDLIVAEVKKQGLDGLVLEGWLQWASMGLLQHPQATHAVLVLVKNLAAKLHTAGKVLILAIPPLVPSNPDRPKAELEHMQELAGAVDGYSLMTYDYSAAAPGPNFPLPWQEQNVKQLVSEAGGKGSKVASAQVLMGLPFYGYDFSKTDQEDTSSSSSKKRKASGHRANPIMGEAFSAVLRKIKPKLKWEEKHAEHKIKYKDGNTRHTVYYPTPAALQARIQLAEQLGAGLSIWELGQGMDAFLDLL